MPRLALLITLTAVLLIPAATQAGEFKFTYKDFRMPSNNIGCAYHDSTEDKPSLRCDILQSSDKPAKPKSCDLDYGSAYAMNRRSSVRTLCHGDTVMNRDAPVLPYGHTKKIGGFTCKSKTSGLRCRNKADHGFFLSRERIDVF
jgi:hypothetical protein